MLTDQLLETILERLPRLTIGVVGDLFLDCYFDLDHRLTEPSLETGLPAYQVTSIRNYPGAAGTIINNLVSLGVGCVRLLSCIGEDGHGNELMRVLQKANVDIRSLITTRDCFTPTYLKPMLLGTTQVRQELNRFDVKNRSPFPRTIETQLLSALPVFWQEVDALVVSDQVSEAECGVITSAVRDELAKLGKQHPEKLLLVDSRERIGLFRQAWLKPNERECLQSQSGAAMPLEAAVAALVRQSGRPVFCTRGEQGILVGQPNLLPQVGVCYSHVPAFRVQGPVDTVGAGDSTSSGIACAIASGATAEDAAAFGCLVASVTVQQIGTTGTATPNQIRERWQQVSRSQLS